MTEDVRRSTSSSSDTFENPLFECADPMVTQYGANYFMACTSPNIGTTPQAFPIRVSDDLVHWGKPHYVFDDKHHPFWARPPGDKAGDGAYWAPEIQRLDGKWLLVFAAKTNARGQGSMAIGTATADALDGPWTAEPGPLVSQGDGLIHGPGDDNSGRIDPSLLIMPSGDIYLYYIYQPKWVHVVQLVDDGHAHLSVIPGTDHELQLTTGGPFTATYPWENDSHGHGVVEGVEAHYRDGQVYLLYSGASTFDGTYAVGVARSLSPFGPFEKKSQPILRTVPDFKSSMYPDGTLVGPGHSSKWIQASDGDYYLLHHVQRKGATGHGGPRLLAVDKMEWVDPEGWPSVSNGYTDEGPQPVPPVAHKEAQPDTRLEVGVHEHDRAAFDPKGDLWQLNVRKDRTIVDWNIACTNGFTGSQVTAGTTKVESCTAFKPQCCDTSDTSESGQFNCWVKAATAAGVEPYVVFQPIDGPDEKKTGPQPFAPNATDFSTAFKAFRSAWPEVKLFAGWNEPNNGHYVARTPSGAHLNDSSCKSTKLDSCGPHLVAKYYLAMKHDCPSCQLVAGELLGADKEYADKYRDMLGKEVPEQWGFHNYWDVNDYTHHDHYRCTKGHGCEVTDVAGWLGNGAWKKTKLWITEVSPYWSEQDNGKQVFDGDLAQAQTTQWLLNLGWVEPRLQRIYLFSYFGPCSTEAACAKTIDSGLVAKGSGYQRPAFWIVAGRTIATTPPVLSQSAEVCAGWKTGSTGGGGGGHPPPTCGTLLAGHKLTGGDDLGSCNGQYGLTISLSDGNLIEVDNQPSFHSIWEQMGSANDQLDMRSDGDLVLYNSADQAIWSTGTAGNPGAYLDVQDDGNLVVYSADGTQVLWSRF